MDFWIMVSPSFSMVNILQQVSICRIHNVVDKCEQMQVFSEGTIDTTSVVSSLMAHGIGIPFIIMKRKCRQDMESTDLRKLAWMPTMPSRHCSLLKFQPYSSSE